MTGSIGYTSPFVPPEWIDAHRLHPLRLCPSLSSTSATAGICPFAEAVCHCQELKACAGLVLTTTCDQMRRAAEMLQRRHPRVFLMNVPVTWQSPASTRLYTEELGRMSDFLVRCGGRIPTSAQLSDTMRSYQSAREQLLQSRAACSAREFTQAAFKLPQTPDITPSSTPQGVPLGLIGGPLCREDFYIYDMIDQAGFRVELDATDLGPRAFPDRFDSTALGTDPLNELARAYFSAIPDAFRRPDSLLQDYLVRQSTSLGLRGFVLARYLWCDEWHAQLGRIKENTGLPVVEIDLGGQDRSPQRIRTRLESLMSIIQ